MLDSVFPLPPKTFEDHPDTVAKLQGVDPKYFETAEEKNRNLKALIELDNTVKVFEATSGNYSLNSLAAVTAKWTELDAAGNTPEDGREAIYRSDLGELWKWNSALTAKAEKSRDWVIGISDTPEENGTDPFSTAGAFVLDKKIEDEITSSTTNKNAIISEENKVEFANLLGQVFMAIKNGNTLEIRHIETDKITTSALEGIVQLVLEQLKTNYLISTLSKFEICNTDGKVIVAIDGESFEYIGKGDTSHSLKGLSFASVADSLGQSGLYESDFAKLTGAIYTKSYTQGGTNSIPNDNNSTQDRIKKLIDDVINETETFDFILLENVNDDWQAISDNVGNFDAAIPFFISNYTIYSNSFATVDELNTFWLSDFATVISGVTAEKGACIKIAYNTNSVEIQVTGAATSDGVITIDVGGTTYNTSILNGDTPSEIISKLEITNYNGYDKSIVNGGDTLKLVDNTQGTETITIPTNTTGATTSLTTATATAYRFRYFMGTVASEFSDINNWQDYLSLYSSYKGIIEALQTNMPTIPVFWVIPPKWNLVWDENSSGYNSNLYNSDGTPDFTTIKNFTNDNGKYYDLIEIQKEVCKNYGLLYADGHHELGITPFNISEFFNQGDVHFKRIVYTMLANLMKERFFKINTTTTI